MTGIFLFEVRRPREMMCFDMEMEKKNSYNFWYTRSTVLIFFPSLDIHSISMPAKVFVRYFTIKILVFLKCTLGGMYRCQHELEDFTDFLYDFFLFEGRWWNNPPHTWEREEKERLETYSRREDTHIATMKGRIYHGCQ